MRRGPKPRRPPCHVCGKTVICYKSPYYHCGCGRFVQQADGTLRAVEVRKAAPCPACGANRLWKGGHENYYKCKKCGASFNLIGGEMVRTRQAGRAKHVKSADMTPEEFESLNGWEPVEVEL